MKSLSISLMLQVLCTNFWFLKMYYLNILSVSSCKHETGTVAWCGKKIQTQEKGPLC